MNVNRAPISDLGILIFLFHVDLSTPSTFDLFNTIIGFHSIVIPYSRIMVLGCWFPLTYFPSTFFYSQILVYHFVSLKGVSSSKLLSGDFL